MEFVDILIIRQSAELILWSVIVGCIAAKLILISVYQYILFAVVKNSSHFIPKVGAEKQGTKKLEKIQLL